MMYDLLIKNGQIIDGLGTPSFKADIVIKEDLIEDIGSFRDEKARRVIDAKGFVVAPGFIDVHTHLDFFSLLHVMQKF